MIIGDIIECHIPGDDSGDTYPVRVTKLTPPTGDWGHGSSQETFKGEYTEGPLKGEEHLFTVKHTDDDPGEAWKRG